MFTLFRNYKTSREVDRVVEYALENVVSVKAHSTKYSTQDYVHRGNDGYPTDILLTMDNGSTLKVWFQNRDYAIFSTGEFKGKKEEYTWDNEMPSRRNTRKLKKLIMSSCEDLIAENRNPEVIDRIMS